MTLTQVPIAPLAPERFKEVLLPEQFARLEATISSARRDFSGRVVWNVNSTARGGGVAELLRSLIAYTRGADVDARWVVIEGDAPFFRLTKRIHNQLHGAPGDGEGLSAEDRRDYDAVAARNADGLLALAQPGDIVLLHDPQTAGMIAPLREAGLGVIWRCHVGLDEPNDLARGAWQFLLPYVQQADAYVFTRSAFAWDDLNPGKLSIIAPSIDAFSAKNQHLSVDAVDAILGAAGIIAPGGEGVPAYRREDGSPARVDRRAEVVRDAILEPSDRFVLQVSRWDRLKDPIGVLDGFAQHVGAGLGAHLVLAGPATAAVTDDPEGAQVLADVIGRRDQLRVDVRERVHLVSLPMDDAEENAAIVNALQRRADIVVQKSLAEGFGLTVSEAMWKARPVVASRVGGIRDQIENGTNGVLVDATDLRAFGAAVTRLLQDAAGAREMGRRAQERVRDEFLGPRHLAQYAELLQRTFGRPPGA